MTATQRWLFFYVLLGLAFASLPVIATAATLSPGCRAATAEDQKEMVLRGLPASFQVCPQDTLILGIGQDFDQWYARLKTMSPCNRSVCTLSCRTRNTGAQVCGPTATRWNAIGCHPNNNTAIFPSVAYGFAAHIELLRRFCGERGRCTIGSVTQQWATANQVEYANFVSRAAGIPANQVFNPNDIELMGRLALGMSCFEAGSLPYDVSELKQGLSMAAGGPRVATPANVGQLLNESLTGAYAANPANSPNSHPGSWTYPSSSTFGGNYIPPSYQPGTYQPQTANLPLPQLNGLSQSSASVGTSTTTGITPASAAGLLIVQPAAVKRGDPIVVSWSSVGMNEQKPCTVALNDAVIVTANSGSKIIQTSDLSSGTKTFTLVCTPVSGKDFKQSATVTVQ